MNQSSTKSKNNHPTPTKNKKEENFELLWCCLLAIRKRLSKESEKKEAGFGDVGKGILEEISPKLLKDFNLICNVIGEEGLKKVFSKQIFLKEERLNILTNQINEILDNMQKIDINLIITKIMKLCMILTEEQYPSVNIKTLY